MVALEEQQRRCEVFFGEGRLLRGRPPLLPAPFICVDESCTYPLLSFVLSRPPYYLIFRSVAPLRSINPYILRITQH